MRPLAIKSLKENMQRVGDSEVRERRVGKKLSTLDCYQKGEKQIGKANGHKGEK